MVEALKSSAVRRQGRDVNVLVYLAQLAPKEALPLLREVRVARLRWFDWERGKEQARLDWIARRLSAGLSVAALDLPPADLAL